MSLVPPTWLVLMIINQATWDLLPCDWDCVVILIRIKYLLIFLSKICDWEIWKPRQKLLFNYILQLYLFSKVSCIHCFSHAGLRKSSFQSKLWGWRFWRRRLRIWVGGKFKDFIFHSSLEIYLSWQIYIYICNCIARNRHLLSIISTQKCP